MCAIVGMAGGRIDLITVAAMGQMLKHRGPDDEGLWVDARAGVALGHRRLAVLDLSNAGRQPMTSRDGRWTITFNGEIFNYVELKKEIEGPWRTGTDTEVLLEACAKWGVEQALNRVVGMFAFGMWDSHGQTLYLARDRVGEKPLVWMEDGARLIFASEIKALAGFAHRRLDPSAVDAYLALGYVPAPLAIYRGSQKLEAGHYLKWQGGTPEIRRYWFPEQRTEPSAPGRLPEILRDAVRIRLRSDVPVALYLSGGLDSSVIAAECKALGANVDAFTVVFDHDRTDLPHAQAVARHLGMRHELAEVDCRRVLADLDNVLTFYDEPFGDSSMFPSFALAKAIGGRYKVVLDGDGGDEVFAGYRHYEYIGWKQVLKRAAAAVGAVDGGRGRGRGSSPMQVYVQSKAIFRKVEREHLLGSFTRGDTITELIDRHPFLSAIQTRSALKLALWSDRHFYLPNDLTYKADIALASSGIEGRAPFLDHRVLEWSQGLKTRDLARGGSRKVALAGAYRGVLPESVLTRKKHGFGAPVSKWLAGELRALSRQALPCPLLDGDRQQDLDGARAWNVLLFALWARRWRVSW